MTWFAQLRHVAAKDIRQARVLLLVYFGVVAWATWDACKLTGPDKSSTQGAMIFVVAIGMFMVAALVQADSPTRSDAFWPSRPFYASAVFAAKLFVMGAIVIGLPLAGQFVALSAIGTDTARIPMLLLVAAWSYALWLFAAMIVAALTRDLRTFAVVFVSLCVLLLLLAEEWPKGLHFSVGVRTQEIATLFGVIAAIALVLTLYRTRDMRGRVWVAGIVAAAALLISSVLPSWPGLVMPSPVATTQAASSTRRATVRAELVDGPSGARAELVDGQASARGSWLQLRVRTEGATATERFGFSVSSATVYLRNGSTLQVPTEETALSAALAAQPYFGSIRGPLVSARGYEVDAKLTDLQRAAVSAGFDSMTVEGRVTIWNRHVIGTMPMAEHAALGIDATHLEIVRLDRSADTVSLTMKIFAVDRSDGQSIGFGFGGPDLALVNETRGQELTFRSGNSGGVSGTLVLPGNEAHVSTAEYDTAPLRPGDRPFVVDDSWISESHLVLSKWTPNESYPVRAKVIVSP
jgi:hypothetical protein